MICSYCADDQRIVPQIPIIFFEFSSIPTARDRSLREEAVRYTRRLGALLIYKAFLIQIALHFAVGVCAGISHQNVLVGYRTIALPRIVLCCKTITSLYLSRDFLACGLVHDSEEVLMV
jgi:hypothetical protein